MSDPTDIPGRDKTPRAAPLQPDKPGSGAGRAESQDAEKERESVQRQKTQSETALDNVREGYD